MRRRLPLAVALLFLAGFVRAQTLGPVDWIFLVDTSASMRGGAPKSKDIWADVKVSIESFADEAGAADTVAIYAFDSDIRRVDVQSPARVSRALHALEANGKYTYLGLAIKTGLEHAASLRGRGDATRRQAVVLFTDGKDNPPDIAEPIAIGSNVQLVGESFVFFVSMGQHEPQLDEFARATTQAKVILATDADAIRNVAREIRARIPPPPKPPAKPPVKARPQPPPSPPPQRTNPLWFAAPLLLLAIAAAAFVVYRRRQNRLEGELEILAPRTSPDLAFVGLPKLQASEVALSTILPAGALAGGDARLFVRRRDGKKKVWIAASGGSLRINDVETPAAELYDADTIDIGGARLRFNRVGDERPEIHQEGDL